MIPSYQVTLLSLPTADDEEEVQVGKLTVRLANAAIFSMVLKLGVIDILRDADEEAMLLGPEIAEKIPAVNPDAPGFMDRMLRLLASYGVVKVAVRENTAGVAERVYSAGPICRFLGMKEQEGGVEGSVAPLFLFHPDWS